MHKLALVSAIFFVAAVSCLAQNAAPPSQSAAAPAYGSQPATQLAPVLSQIEQAAQQANLDLAKLRIEKWKADGDTRNQSSANAQSLTRNLSGALPEMLVGVRNAPNSLAPAVKLYRDLNAVYDVFSSVTESAGAFGPKEDYRSLATDSQSLDAARRALGDYLENAAAIKDAQLQDLLARAATAAAKPAPVTRTIVDDNEAPKPVTRKKKKAVKPASQSASTPQTTPPPQ
jgi:hypothetical protein